MSPEPVRNQKDCPVQILTPVVLHCLLALRDALATDVPLSCPMPHRPMPCPAERAVKS
jgi:hypothetical protein